MVFDTDSSHSFEQCYEYMQMQQGLSAADLSAMGAFTTVSVIDSVGLSADEAKEVAEFVKANSA